MVQLTLAQALAGDAREAKARAGQGCATTGPATDPDTASATAAAPGSAAAPGRLGAPDADGEVDPESVDHTPAGDAREVLEGVRAEVAGMGARLGELFELVAGLGFDPGMGGDESMAQDEALEAVVTATQQVLNAAQGVQHATIAHTVRREHRLADLGPAVVHGVGHVDPLAVTGVGLALGISANAAAARCHQAARLAGRHPRLLRAMGAGAVDQTKAARVDTTTREASDTVCGVLDVALADRVPGLDPTRVGGVYRRAWERIAPEEATAARRAARRVDDVEVTPGPDGSTQWWAQIPTLQSAAMWAAVTTLAAQYRKADPGLRAGAARAHALADLVLGNTTVTAQVTLGIPVIRTPITTPTTTTPTPPTAATPTTAPLPLPAGVPTPTGETGETGDASTASGAAGEPTAAEDPPGHAVLADLTRLAEAEDAAWRGWLAETGLDAWATSLHLDPDLDDGWEAVSDQDWDDAFAHLRGEHQDERHPDEQDPEDCDEPAHKTAVSNQDWDEAFAYPHGEEPDEECPEDCDGPAHRTAVSAPDGTGVPTPDGTGAPTPDRTPMSAGDGIAVAAADGTGVSAGGGVPWVTSVEIPKVGVIDAATVELLLTRTDVTVGRALLDAATGCLLETRTDAYRVPKRMREFLATRDGTCRWFGCTRPAVADPDTVGPRNADLDHVTPWPAGATTPTGLAHDCRRHHRAKQAPGYRVAITPEGSVTITSPTGTTRTTTPTEILGWQTDLAIDTTLAGLDDDHRAALDTARTTARTPATPARPAGASEANDPASATDPQRAGDPDCASDPDCAGDPDCADHPDLDGDREGPRVRTSTDAYAAAIHADAEAEERDRRCAEAEAAGRYVDDNGHEWLSPPPGHPARDAWRHIIPLRRRPEPIPNGWRSDLLATLAGEPPRTPDNQLPTACHNNPWHWRYDPHHHSWNRIITGLPPF
ncbi:hypothetical protein ACQP1U_02255 [Actinomycetota bacterium]